jgi:hypothetical protein
MDVKEARNTSPCQSEDSSRRRVVSRGERKGGEKKTLAKERRRKTKELVYTMETH